jgi:NitT/TauT family transport system permease protein
VNLFSLGATLKKRQGILLGVAGIVFVLAIWYGLTAGETPLLPAATLPKPWRVLTAFPDLYLNNELVKNTTISVGVNLAGYVEAILISIPFGFLIGLYPLFKGLFQNQVDALRYIPLTGVISIFIAWFGINLPMKAHFLAFGIIIYMLPVIVQRIREVDDVYLKTVYTLGASDWQKIRTVYFPSVISRFFSDIRVLTAISWTYIIFVENIGNEGGIGATIWRAGSRQGRYDKVFALLILIMLIGVIQDKIMIRLEKEFFPYKFQAEEQEKAGKLKKASVVSALSKFILTAVMWVFLLGYLLLFLDEYTGILGHMNVLRYLFADSVWAIHVIVFSILGYQVYSLLKKTGSKVPAK